MMSFKLKRYKQFNENRSIETWMNAVSDDPICDREYVEYMMKNYAWDGIHNSTNTIHGLYEIHDDLSVSCKYFNCKSSLITKLNIKFRYLDAFVCRESNLKELPELPDSVTFLNFDKTKIKDVEKLPKDLKILYCTNSKIKKLPVLPKSLEELYVDNSKLEELPELPQSLLYLNCAHTKIEKLPKLPKKLLSLYCHNTMIEELPELPPRLDDLNCIYTNITEIPRKFYNQQRSDKWLKYKNVKPI